ncbi:hypothetical protein Tco_1501136 [Tanacetum coccineum]
MFRLFIGFKTLGAQLSKVEGCGGLRGSWLTINDKEVTKQDLVLKGGDIGACKLLGDVMHLHRIIAIKPPSPSFRVDERMIWIEISGLPLCAWGSNAYKRVASVFGKFMFFEVEESITMSEVQVQELGSWNINIYDHSLDTSSHMDINDVVKVADSIEDNSIDDLNDLNAKFNKLDQDFNDDEGPMINLTDALLKPSEVLK